MENIVKLFRDSFEEFFPPTTGEQLFAITTAFKEFTAKIKAFTENADQMAKLERIFKGVAAGLDIVRNVVDWVVKGFGKLIGIAEPVGGSFLDVVASIGDFLVGVNSAIKNSETFQTVLANVGAVLETIKGFARIVGTAIGTVFGKIRAKIEQSGILTKLGDKINALLAGFPVAVEKLKSWAKGIIAYVKSNEKLQAAWGSAKATLRSIWETITEFYTRIKEAVVSFLNADTSGLEGFWEKLKARFSTMGVSLAHTFDGVKKKLAEAWENLKAFFSKLFGKSGGEATKLNDQGTITVAPTIETSNWFTAIRDKVTGIWGNVKQFLTGFFRKTVPEFFTQKVPGFLSSIPDTLSAFFSQFKGVDWAGIMLKAAGAFAVFKMVSILNNIGKLGKGIGTFFDGFGKVADNIGDALKTFGKKGIAITKTIKKKDSLGNNVLKIAEAVAILVAAIYVIGKMDDAMISKGLTVLGVLAIGLVAVAATFKLFGSGETKGILYAAGALAMLTGVVYVLGNMDLAKVNQGLYAVTMLLGLLTIFTNFNKSLGKSTGLVAIAVALNLLLIPIKVLGTMGIPQLIQGITSIAVLLTALTLFTKFAKGLGKSTGLVAIAVALNLLLIPIKVLGGMDWLSLGKAGVGIVGLLGMLFLFTKFGKGLGKSTGLVAIAVALNLLVIPMKTLGKMEPGDLIKGVLAIGGLLTAIGILMKLSSGMDMKSVAPMLVSLGGIAVLLEVFAHSLQQVADIPWQTMLAFSGGLSALIVAAAFATKLLQGVNPVGAAKAAAAIAAMGVGIGAFLTAISGSAASASGDIFVIGANLSGFSNTVSKLNTRAISNACDSMKQLAGMAGYVGTKDTSKLEAFASQISLLGARLMLFNWGVSGIGENGAANAVTMVTNIGAIADKMVELQGKNINLADVGAALTNLGSGIQLYAAACATANGYMPEGGANVDTAAIKQMFIALAESGPDTETVNKLAAYAKGGGNDLTNFSLGIVALGNAMSEYGKSIRGIGAFDSLRALLVLNGINDLQNRLPRGDNSVIAWISGNKQALQGFSENVALLGGALNTFAGSLTEDTSDLATKAVEVLDAIAAIQGKLTAVGADGKTVKFGGVASWFEGDESDLNKLGSGMNVLGAGFKEFVGSLSAFKSKKALTEAAIGVIDSLAEIHVALSGTGKFDWFTGAKNLASFGGDLSAFGTRFSEFCGALTGVTVPTNMNEISGVVDKFVSVATALNGIAMTYNLSERIKWFGTDLKSFFSDDAGIGSVAVDNDKLTQITAFIDKVADIAVKLNGIYNVDSGVIQGMLDGLSALTIPDFAATGTDAATAFLNGLTIGIQNGTSSVTIEVTSLSSAGRSAANETYESWKGTGRYLAAGLANGISSMASTVRNSAIGVATGTIRSIQMVWSVHSPSKVSEDLGMYWDLGLSGGMDKYASAVNQSSESVGRTAISSAKSVLSGMTATLANNMDPVPIIRPVIDISDVLNGMNTIDGLFTANRTVNAGMLAGQAFNRNAAQLNFDGGRITGGNDNRDVVNAVNSLTEKFNTLSEAVANMKLVLDTGEFVGHIAKPMDKQLGVIAGRNARG